MKILLNCLIGPVRVTDENRESFSMSLPISLPNLSIQAETCREPPINTFVIGYSVSALSSEQRPHLPCLFRIAQQ